MFSITMHMLVPSVLPHEFLLFHLETFTQSSKVLIIYSNIHVQYYKLMPRMHCSQPEAAAMLSLTIPVLSIRSYSLDASLHLSRTSAAYPEDCRASCSAASGLWQIAKCLNQMLM